MSKQQEALRNLVDAFHEGRASHAQPEASGYVQSLVEAAEAALAKGDEEPASQRLTDADIADIYRSVWDSLPSGTREAPSVITPFVRTFARALLSARAVDLSHAPTHAVALDIAKWFVNGDRPDEWKLKEWAEALDRDAIAKAYEWRAATSKAST